MPRPLGDGMDCEDMKHQPAMTPDSHVKTTGRHRNLQATPRSASIVKTEHPKYIPHEPVKGAVKPVVVGIPFSTGSSKVPTNNALTNQNLRNVSKQNPAYPKQTKASLNAPTANPTVAPSLSPLISTSSQYSTTKTPR